MQTTPEKDEGRQPAKAPTFQQTSFDFTERQAGRTKKMSPRHQRLLTALMQGPISREQADRIAGASNSPNEIYRLRRGYGLDICCKKQLARDRDGKSVRPGTYSLTADDRSKVSKLLKGIGHGTEGTK